MKQLVMLVFVLIYLPYKFNPSLDNFQIHDFKYNNKATFRV